MNDIIIESNPYIIDVDKNGFPCFTQKNIDFITAIVGIDSNYSVAYDCNNPSSSSYLLRNVFPDKKEILEKAVKLIDKENSTHLSVSGYKKGGDNNKGITIMVNAMVKKVGISKLRERIKNGDTKIVNEIADFIPNRYNPSFASKFCAFCNRNCFNKDDYSIYDNVLKEIIPYYAYVYLGECHWKKISGKNARNESKIAEEFADKNGDRNYEGYNDLIGRIIEKNNMVFNAKISRKDFDLLLWYYFKGSNSKIIEANECLGDPTKILSFAQNL